tara:strand:+ start:4198 stop:4947 length:750 start_codon:yes stop_codon:yes gene_type:complete
LKNRAEKQQEKFKYTLDTNSIGKVLLIKDHKSQSSTIQDALLSHRYELRFLLHRNDNNKIIKEINEIYFDLIIIELKEKNYNVVNLCEKIRKLKYYNPILVISEKDNVEESIQSLEVGADDYLLSPYNKREFLARCKALIRRGKLSINTDREFLCYGDLCLFNKEYRVTKYGMDLHFSPKEYKIIELFIKHPRQAFKREEILKEVWCINNMVDPKTIDVHIRWIRKKIEDDPSNPKYIKTLRGFGYIFG